MEESCRSLAYVWVECMSKVPTVDNHDFGPCTHYLTEPMVLGQHCPDNKDDTLQWGDTTLIMVHIKNTEIEPPPPTMLMYS